MGPSSGAPAVNTNGLSGAASPWLRVICCLVRWLSRRIRCQSQRLYPRQRRRRLSRCPHRHWPKRRGVVGLSARWRQNTQDVWSMPLYEASVKRWSLVWRGSGHDTPLQCHRVQGFLMHLVRPEISSNYSLKTDIDDLLGEARGIGSNSVVGRSAPSVLDDTAILKLSL